MLLDTLGVTGSSPVSPMTQGPETQALMSGLGASFFVAFEPEAVGSARGVVLNCSGPTGAFSPRHPTPPRSTSRRADWHPIAHVVRLRQGDSGRCSRGPPPVRSRTPCTSPDSRPHSSSCRKSRSRGPTTRKGTRQDGEVTSGRARPQLLVEDHSDSPAIACPQGLLRVASPNDHCLSVVSPFGLSRSSRFPGPLLVILDP